MVKSLAFFLFFFVFIFCIQSSRVMAFNGKFEMLMSLSDFYFLRGAGVHGKKP